MDDPYRVEDLEEQYGRYTRRKVVLIAVLAVLAVVMIGLSLSFNGRVGFVDSLAYFFKHIFGATYDVGTPEWVDDYAVWTVYTPRVLIAIITGAGLAACGVVMQALLNNPLADPYTTGLSDGACFGAVAAIVMGFTFSGVAESMGIVTNAFLGGLVPALVIIFLSRVVTMSPAVTILIGVALSYLFSGLEMLMMVSTDADTLKNAFLWQIGSFTDTAWSDLTIPFVVVAVSSAVMFAMSRKLNLLALGDDSASSLGLDVDNFRTLLMVVVAVSVASMISFSGIIGFVSLVIPHAIRMLIGGDNRYLIPASMAAGAVFLMVADLLSRVVVYPDELRVGLIASIIGSPIFLYMILRKRRYGEVYRWRCQHSRVCTGRLPTGS
ncbi:MAG: iron ABC transporter permease [Candidatus Methanomethylophilaceae archaeon]|nr:iron ABC transporter permease [Candidatus Methanomethylophilaceae archaeon]